MTQSSIEHRLAALEKRNIRVEADKAWETSLLRKVAIAVVTYVVVVTYLHFVLQIDPWLNALVPVFGYLLSTVTIGILKRIWLARR